MKRLILIFLFLAPHVYGAPLTKYQRLENKLNSIEHLLSQYVHQQETDRANLKKADECFKSCRENYEDPEINACYASCRQIPVPPGGC